MFQTPTTPPASPPANVVLLDLPTPPTLRESPKEAAAVNRAFWDYYWPRHFEKGPVDPASFIDRVMTDYADHETNVVGKWVEDMSRLYKIYRACLNYGAARGTPNKAAEAKSYQGVTLTFST
jgi:hypothetical protein